MKGGDGMDPTRLFGIGARLRKARGNRTQAEIAEKADVSLPTYKTWEGGTSLPKIDGLTRVANVLEVSPCILMYGSEVKGKSQIRSTKKRDGAGMGRATEGSDR